jgi:F-type H+-transporting ATPase subunit delta
MTTSATARHYARAFYDVARPTGRLEELATALDAFAELAEGSADLRHALLNPGFTQAEKFKVLAAIAEKLNLPKEVHNFSKVLVNLRHVKEVGAIAKTVRDLADEAAGRIQAQVATATALDDSHKQALSSALGKAVGKTVVLSEKVKPELLGGVRVSLGSVVFDGSVRGQLDRLKRTLTTGR